MKAKMNNVLAAMRRALEETVERDRAQLHGIVFYNMSKAPVAYAGDFYYGI